MQSIRFRKRLTDQDPPVACEALAAGTGLSKTRIKRAMIKGAAWHRKPGGKMQRIRRATANVRPGDVLAIYYDEAILNRQPPRAYCVKDLEHYSVWFKPAGQMTQGTRFGDHCALLRQVDKEVGPGRKAYPVHRIDREASGLVIIAHSREAAARISALFRNGRIEKHYQVAARGDLGQCGIKRRIEIPLDGTPALTEYRPVQYDFQTDRSLAIVKTVTGRRHQIRRHFEAVGHPLIGDPRYGKDNKNQAGLQLVAFAVAFDCPFGNGRVEVSVQPEKILL